MQGLISNDVRKVIDDQTIYSALLTPQGKFLFDFFILSLGESLYLECEQDRLAALQARLRQFKLRSDVNITDVTQHWQVVTVFGNGCRDLFNLSKKLGHTLTIADGVAFTDPRLEDLGVRLILPRNAELPSAIVQDASMVSFDVYEQHRLHLGVPDGSRDMLVEKAIPLECNLDALNAIDWDKGCYMGQELTSRTKHRGLVRKRLLPVQFQGDTLPFLTPLTLNGKEIGSMRTSSGGVGLALIRLEVLETTGQMLLVNNENKEVVPRIPKFIRSMV